MTEILLSSAELLYPVFGNPPISNSVGEDPAGESSAALLSPDVQQLREANASRGLVAYVEMLLFSSCQVLGNLEAVVNHTDCPFHLKTFEGVIIFAPL